MSEEKILKAVDCIQAEKYEQAYDLFYDVSLSGLCAKNYKAIAMQFLGWMYDQGLHVEKNAQTAIDYWLKGAFLGDCHSQSSVADCYFRGLGVDQNFLKAYCWYKVANKFDTDNELGSEVLEQIGKCESCLSNSEINQSNIILQDILSNME